MINVDQVGKPRVLVAATDPLTATMPGPSIRAWHLAHVLAAECEVALVSTVAADRTSDVVTVGYADSAEVERLTEWMDVAFVPPGMLRHSPALSASEKPLIIDVYDPFHLENLEPDGRSSPHERDATVTHLNGVLNEAFARGDFFCCASERQRDFWLGSLTAAGRVNPYTYAEDPNLSRLIDVVPFGLATAAPQRRGPGLRGVVDGIGAHEKVILWGGGVYNWFDPGSLLYAIDRLRQSVPEVRLVFLGMGHPNPAIPEMRVAVEARALSDHLGLTGTHVFFKEGWVPFDSRADVLLDADVAVSTHLTHIETRFSFRTRVLDYLWAGLPMVLTGGDTLAELVAAQGAGVTVPPGDVEAIAEGLALMLRQPPPPEAAKSLAAQFSWETVARPLLEFCRSPRIAPDRAAGRVPVDERPPHANPEPVPLGHVGQHLARAAVGAHRARSWAAALRSRT